MRPTHIRIEDTDIASGASSCPSTSSPLVSCAIGNSSPTREVTTGVLSGSRSHRGIFSGSLTPEKFRWCNLWQSSLGITTESHRSGGVTHAPTTVVGGRGTEPYPTPKEGFMSHSTQSTTNEKTQPTTPSSSAGSPISQATFGGGERVTNAAQSTITKHGKDLQPTYNGGEHPRTRVGRMSNSAPKTSTRSPRCARGISSESSPEALPSHRVGMGSCNIAHIASGPAEGRHTSEIEKDPPSSVGLLSANSGAEVVGSILQNSEGDHEDFPLVLHLQT